MNCSEVYMLASDHRWQWEEWCDGEDIPRQRIAEVKRLVVDAFLLARDRSAEVQRAGALLLDGTYGAEAVAHARARELVVGTPVERAGVFPLEWEHEPFHAALPGNSFAKVLIRYRPEWDTATRRGQMDKLLQLQAWCRQEGMPLLIEVVIIRRDENEQEFEERGRPRLLAALIREAYRKGLEPDLWKIEGAGSEDGAALVDEAIRQKERPRQIILGKGADETRIARWFEVAARLSSAVGFAIGRSVFWGPGTAYLLGKLPAADASQEMASRYLRLIDEWQQRASPDQRRRDG